MNAELIAALDMIAAGCAALRSLPPPEMQTPEQEADGARMLELTAAIEAAEAEMRALASQYD